jgi:hypothetical protein
MAHILAQPPALRLAGQDSQLIHQSVASKQRKTPKRKEFQQYEVQKRRNPHYPRA